MKILIVDDSSVLAKTLAEAGVLFGCEQIDTVDSGENAIGEAIMADYDLITLDVRMEGISGMDALSVLRGVRPRAILALITAYVEDLDEEVLQAADVVIQKPFKIEIFRDVLGATRRIVERRRTLRSLGVGGL